MCTVSFVPLTKDHFILTSNRDETTARGLASTPQIIGKENYLLACPVDPLGSGTWIAASTFGDMICLLNGAFKRHKHQPPYRKSRGLVVLDYFDIGDPQKFVAEYDLSNIEPFTMVMVSRYNGTQLFELRWDGNGKFFKKLDSMKWHLWSSATLYSDQLIKKKKEKFEELLSESLKSLPFISETMIEIHGRFLYEDWVKPPEKVDVVATLSITCVESNSDELKMYYRDLVQKDLPLASLTLHINKEVPKFRNVKG
jgi:uncharacterized protein with NRDE domain